jgi:hypothetical protein
MLKFTTGVGAGVGTGVGAGVGAGVGTGVGAGVGAGVGGTVAALSVEQQFANVVVPAQQAALPPAPCVAVSQHDTHDDGRVATFQPYRLLLYPAQIGTYWLPLAEKGFQHVLASPLASMRSAYTGDPDLTLMQQFAKFVASAQHELSPPAPCVAVSQHDLHARPPAYAATDAAL